MARSPQNAAAKGGESLVEQVYAQLEAKIVTLELPPGALLSEATIGRELGVSRTPVGEAIQRLARQGLVTILPRRGAVVSGLDVADQLRILELRRELYRFMARVGARRATAAQREQLRSVARSFHLCIEQGGERAHLRADRAFHELFVACARNNHLPRIIEPIDAQSRRFWYAHEKHSEGNAQSARLHAGIARAMAAGDEAGAMRAADALGDYLEAFVRNTLDAPAGVNRPLVNGRGNG